MNQRAFQLFCEDMGMVNRCARPICSRYCKQNSAADLHRLAG